MTEKYNQSYNDNNNAGFRISDVSILTKTRNNHVTVRKFEFEYEYYLKKQCKWGLQLQVPPYVLEELIDRKRKK